MNVKKVSTYIGLIIAAFTLFTMLQGGILKVVTLIYHQEIEDFQTTVEFTKTAQDSLIPKFNKEIIDLRSWREEKSKTKAIGLRKNIATGEIFYRAGLDLKLHRAYYDPIKKGYYYDRNGSAYPCY